MEKRSTVRKMAKLVTGGTTKPKKSNVENMENKKPETSSTQNNV